MENKYFKIFAVVLMILNSSSISSAKKMVGIEPGIIQDPWADISEDFKFSLTRPYTFGELLKTYWDKYDRVLKGDISGGLMGGVRPEYKYSGNTFYNYYNELREEDNIDPLFSILNTRYPLPRPRYYVAGAEQYKVPFAWDILGLSQDEINKNAIDKKVKELKLKWEKHPNVKERQAIMNVVNAAAQYLKK
jgi:hypothetical protein